MLTWVEVSKSALRSNLHEFHEKFPSLEIYPVIKSNAYGAATHQVFDSIKDMTDSFAVVSTGEALEVRGYTDNHTIFVLSILEGDVGECIRKNIELPLYNEHYLGLIESEAKAIGIPAKVHLKIDTGTHRVGFTPTESVQITKRIEKSKHLILSGVFSHYAASEEIPEYTEKQKETFDNVVSDILKEVKEKNIKIHMACSAAAEIESIPKLSNAARIGLSLYGYWPSELAKRKSTNIVLNPSISWKTRVINLREVKKGEPIGYGCSHILESDSLVATIPVGYFDGYDRGLSNKGEVLIRGKRCRVLGRVCMNLTMVDASGLDVGVGDEVTLIGKQGKSEITPENIADLSGTINYEVLSRIREPIPRVLVK